jgi:hypothetical protein
VRTRSHIHTQALTVIVQTREGGTQSLSARVVGSDTMNDLAVSFVALSNNLASVIVVCVCVCVCEGGGVGQDYIYTHIHKAYTVCFAGNSSRSYTAYT